MNPLLRDVVLAFRVPAAVALNTGAVTDAPCLIRGLPCSTGFPPWPTAPDLLVNSLTKEFVGLVYGVQAEFCGAVSEFASTLDPACIKFVHRTTPQLGGQAVPQLGGELRILWGHGPDLVVTAQLGGDLWYYRGDSSTEDPLERAEGIGLDDLQELLAEYGLVAPQRLRVGATLAVNLLGTS